MFALLAVIIAVPALTLYVAPFIPIVTAAVTKLQAAGWVKLAVTTVTSLAVAAVTTAIERGADLVVTWGTLGRAAVTLGVAMASYLVFRKPVADPVAQNVAPDKGLG
jgi:hypothetical protein